MSDDNVGQMEAHMRLELERRTKKQIHKRFKEIGIPTNIDDWYTIVNLEGVLLKAEKAIAEARRELAENPPG